MSKELNAQTPWQPRWLTITGWCFTLLIFGTLCFSAAAKFSVFWQVGPWEEGAAEFQKLGISPKSMAIIGGVELACAVLYFFPKTAILGAVLLQGYLGAAFCTHVIAHERDPAVEVDPAALIVGALTWLGILLREPRLRAIACWR